MAKKQGRLKTSSQKRVRSRRTYPDELKSEAVQMMLDGHSAQSVVNNLGLSSVNLVYRWKERKLAESGPAASSLDARVRQLEEELRHVERERDILKKALAIFSRT
jgi:transposase